MNIFVYALSLVAFAGAMLFTLCSNTKEPRDGNLLVVALIPGAVVVCVAMLLADSGISLYWVLGTLFAALGATVAGVWRVNMSDTYESV